MRAFTALCVIAGALFMATPAHAGLGRVVVLGDSFATGTGLGTQLPGSPATCDRRDGGFAERAMLKATHGAVVNQSCNGATTQALFYGSTALGLPEQTSVLDGSERVVILAIGDNNAKFGEVTDHCLAHNTPNSLINTDACTDNYGSGASNTLPGIATNAIKTTQGFQPSVGSTLDQIHAKSPLAKIFLVGYLRIAPPDGVSCNTPFDGFWQRSYLNLTPNDAPVFAAWEDAVRAALTSEAADRPFVHFVDMQPASNPHNACNPAAQRWVNSYPVITPDAVDGLNLHPSGAGAEAVSTALLDAMNAEGLTLGPDITISTPANNSYTTTATVNLDYTATSNLGTPDCTPASGSSLSLDIGANTFTVTCTDSAGNTSSASTTISRGSVPTVAITAPGAQITQTTASAVNVAFTVDGSTSIPGGTTCKVGDLSSASTQTNPFPLALGGNSVTVTCTNEYGSGSANFSITRGNVPAVAIVAPTTGSSTSSAQVNVSFTVDGSATIPAGTTCTVNTAATASATANTVALSLGPNTLAVSCTNTFGDGSASVTVSRGNGPTVTRTSPTGSPTNSRSQTFTYSGAPGGTFQCKLDAAAYSTCLSSPATLTNLSDGTHNLSVTQTDSLGVVGQPTTITWTVDATPPNAPTVSRTSPTVSPTKSTSQTISFSGAEAGGTFQCKLDSGPYSPCGVSPVVLTGVSTGTHIYSVTQTDATGNVSAASSVSWVVDVTPPPTPNVSGPAGITATPDATISYFDTEAGLTFQCKLDSLAYAPCGASPISLTDLSTGAHTYYVTATDAAGNVSAAGTSSWTFDPNAFGVSITSAPSNPSNAVSPSFTFTSTVQVGPTFECKLDAGSFAACTSPKNYSNLPAGSHTFTVRAKNGELTTSNVIHTWVIDSTPPAAPLVTRTNPTATSTSSTKQSFTFAGAESGGTLSCKVNTSEYQTCSSPLTLPIENDLFFGDGPYTFSVRQTDAAGNTGSVTTVAWVVDTIAPAAPTVTRTSPSESPTSSTAQVITFDGETGSTYECKLDADSYAPCTSNPATLTDLALGSHIFSVRQIDAAGNSSAAAAVAWTIVPPAPPGSTTPNNPPFELAFSAKLSTVTPNAIKPAKTGSPFSLKSRGSVGAFRVTLSEAATVSVRLERVGLSASRTSTSWVRFKLKAGHTKIYLSGRTSNRALPIGRYRVRLTVSGTSKSLFSRTFRIIR